MNVLIQEKSHCFSALKKATSTWKKDKDGIPMVDYSSQNVILFNIFLKETKGLDFDIMLEIKDKENF
jgi:UV DNA damage endonuclease